MKTIKCAKCRSKIFKYKKIGKGRILRCYKSRIIEDYSTHEGNQIKCSCGELIGIDEGGFIKMKQNGFVSSGGITKK